MHIYFSGIGGTAIGPLALIAKQAGYTVSGSDKQNSSYIVYLKKHGVENIHIGQTKEQIEKVHQKQPIDWLVYTSALTLENPNPPELQFCKDNNIKISKRDELLNKIINDKKLKLIAVAGTHGKTTTTAMAIWLFKQLGIQLSYSVGAKISFGEMGQYINGSEYFVYEADEFDYNFLAFTPYLSLITGVTYDHHEIFKTREIYKQAFIDFINQSEYSLIWQEDAKYLNLKLGQTISVINAHNQPLEKIRIKGYYNRLDAWLVISALQKITNQPLEKLIELMNNFPGLQRRMEQIVPNLYSDYAHTPEKIKGCMSVALELAKESNQKVVIVYEPLTNRRQHYMIDNYKDCFNGASKVYWIPSYLAREDPNQRIITPVEMISHLTDPLIANPMKRDTELKQKIEEHLKNGDIVVGMAGGGGNSLDEWLRQEFV